MEVVLISGIGLPLWVFRLS